MRKLNKKKMLTQTIKKKEGIKIELYFSEIIFTNQRAHNKNII